MHPGGCRTPTLGGYVPFIPRAKKCLELSWPEALALRRALLRVEPLALALITTKSSAAAHILAAIGASIPRLRSNILQHR